MVECLDCDTAIEDIQEQIEEEHVSKVILEIARQEDSWISKASAIRAAYEKIS